MRYPASDDQPKRATVVSEAAAGPGPADTRGLAAGLAGPLREACDNRLSEITWFKADWQRGGAATGTARFRLDNNDEVPVVVKLPVVQREWLWTSRLQRDHEDAVVPKLYAAGETLGGYDLAWIVIEHFPHGPLGLHWDDKHIERMADAAARFYAAASSFEVDEPPKTEEWDELIHEAQQSVKINTIANTPRWKSAMKTLRGRLTDLVSEWRSRPVNDWLHGDLHLANAMSRDSLDAGVVYLIDLAEVHAGHWVEDAVFLERQLWARPERLRAVKPVKAIAESRRGRGLPVDDGYQRLAMIRRALLAATAPRFLKTEGHPKHLEACLDWLERALLELK